MSGTDPDAFHEPALDFALRAPRGWRFMPPAWSPAAQLRNGSGADAWIRGARLPFCCAMGQHDSPRHALPTLQVTARPRSVPTRAEAVELLQSTIDFLASRHDDFVLVDATADAIVGGCRANVIRARFALPVEIDGHVRPLSVASRSYTVFGGRYTFSLGLSGSADPRYLDQADLDAVIASVRIGR